MNIPVLFDSHCHLDFAEFDENRPQLWQACRHQGVAHLLVPGTCASQWKNTYLLTQELAGVFMAVGVHPWWVEGINSVLKTEIQMTTIASFLERQMCVAIGECGLDKMIATPLVQQQIIFEQQLQLACDTQYPLIIHVHKAHNEMLSLLSHYKPKAGGIIHGFTGSIELAQQYWQLGFCLGIGGSITYPRATKTRNSAQQLPLDAIVLETDAPDMPLNGLQGQVNSPLRVVDVAKALAELRGEPFNDIAQKTTENCKRLFQL